VNAGIAVVPFTVLQFQSHYRVAEWDGELFPCSPERGVVGEVRQIRADPPKQSVAVIVEDGSARTPGVN